MSKTKQIELPPTWDEIRAGEVSAPSEGGWSTSDLVQAWGKSRGVVLQTLNAKGWICVGKRRELAISGDIKTVPIYAPKA